MSLCAPQLLEKTPTEREYFTMNFNNWLDTNESISGILAITSEKRGGGISDLVISESGISDGIVYMWIESGTQFQTYRIEVRAQLSTSRIVEGDGLLKVTDK